MTDHLRATCALLAAGVMPTREGRGYVLRRIMRRAMRYAHGIGANGANGADGAVLHECLPFVAKVMASSLPTTYDIKAMARCVREEEEQFSVTLTRGLTLLQDQLAALPKDNLLLSGTMAFTLYDTYGFPLEVTRDVMRRLHARWMKRAIKSVWRSNLNAAAPIVRIMLALPHGRRIFPRQNFSVMTSSVARQRCWG